ncbi:MAG: nucleotidyltransferase family protein [Odoribacteraceae bacterium]|jgi:hypothetical protein|nr:nucleotidyltransferase family protein [Odoribacteraceae bacterium]
MDAGNINTVRNILLLNQFSEMLPSPGEALRVVPLKGISLLLDLYKDDYARDVGDIDLLVPARDLQAVIARLEELGYAFKNRVDDRLRSKRKFDMIHPDARRADVDVHVDLVNKKFYRLSTGDFTAFALSRLIKPGRDHLDAWRLSPVDEWLYLAQHYCFHLFSNDKWLTDLYLLQRRFTREEVAELVAVAARFHFRRVVTAVARCLANNYPRDEIKIPALVAGRHRLFDALTRPPGRKFARSLPNRVIAFYWEFIFIDDPRRRFNAYLQLLVPAPVIFRDIYNRTSKISYALPLHAAGVLLTSLLFLPIFYFKCRGRPPRV